ncbi:NF038129 family PEP-CTERM protein [Massilia sp. W12]|uniref:NF038129 family PEP-CTERM protein n=1 Tax=Massilia sp. W12 TaxID=3126507 RepID=UPI0030CA61B2
MMLRKTLLGLSLLAAFGAAQAETWHVEVDTSALSGLGFFDFQFNPGALDAASGTARVSRFQGVLDAIGAQNSGDVSGALPASLNFANSQSYNDVFQAVQLGGRFSFNLDFDGDMLRNPNGIGSAFAFSIYGADGASVLGQADAASGSLLTFNLGQPGMAVSHVVFDNQIIAVSSVPEASEWAMLAGGLVAMAAFVRRRRQQAA